MKRFTLPAVLLTLSALLTACPGQDPPSGGISPNVIEGTVSGGTFPSSVAYLATLSDVSTANEGTLTTPNQLKLNLSSAPEAEFMFPLLSGCAFSGTNSAFPDVGLFTEIDLFSKDADPLGYVVQAVTTGGSLANSIVARMYSSSAASIKGYLTCSGGSSSFTVNLDLNLAAGWNALEYSASNTSLTLKNFTGAVTTELKAAAFEPQVLIGLENSNLTFSSSDTLTVPAHIIQVGAYSGTIQLSTDIPGLTVEPASLTLNPLSAQSLKPASPLLKALGVGQQRLDTTLTFKYSGSSLYSQPFHLIAKDTSGKQVGGGTGTVTSNLPGLAISYVYPDSLQILPNTTANINVNVYGVNGFSSSVNVGLTDLPLGVTATQQTVNLSTSGSATLTLTATSPLTPGDYTATLTASGGGKSASHPIKINIPKPGVNVTVGSYGSAYKSVYQNSSDTLPVSISSYAGFSGSTTISLSDLPAGVTATPKTVQVTPGTTTTIEIPLNISADATLGLTTISVNSPDLAANTTAPKVQLTVYPARIKLGQSSTLAGRAAEGFWTVESQTYTGPTYQVNLARYTAAGLAQKVALQSASYTRYVSMTDGSLLALGADYATSTAQQIKDDGTVTSLGNSPIQSGDIASSATDYKGRVWLILRSVRQNGVLSTWLPSNGQITAVDDTQDYVLYSNNGTITISPNGKYILYAAFNGNWLIDPVTDTVKKAVFNDMVSSAAPADDGTIWYSNSGQLKRLNSDGSVTTFNNVSSASIIGFDRQNTSILWLSSYNALLKFDTVTGTTQTIQVPSSGSALNVNGGGTAYVWTDYSSGANSAYASFLK